MKGQLNPELKVGDRIMCFHMEGETGVPPGTLGTVIRISRDPFESENDSLITVKWDNGSTLALITSTDAWKLAPQEIKEQATGSPEYDFFRKNPEVFENFDYKFLKKFLQKLRDSGVINMFQAEMADEAKNKMIQGLLKYMESKNMDVDDMSRVNNLIDRFAVKINQLYVTFPLSNN